MLQRILVWDLPTRVFHWSFALSFAGAYLTAESERYRDIHLALGYVFLGMLVFRLVWGLVGTAYVRFRAFWFKPAEIVAYLRALLRRCLCSCSSPTQIRSSTCPFSLVV